jgi:hypothetical protein
LFVIGGFWRDEVERDEAPGDRPGVAGDSAEDTDAERLRPCEVMGIGREGGVEGEAMVDEESRVG